MADVTVHTDVVVGTIMPSLAIFITLVRLVVRWRDKKVGSDDYWVIGSLVSMILFIPVLWYHAVPPSPQDQAHRILYTYAGLCLIYIILWMARLSILSQVLRIVSDRKQRIILQSLMGVFVVILVFLIGQVFYVCEKDPSWKTTPLTQCVLGKSVAITRLCFDIFADIVLVSAPISLIYRINTSKKHRNTLIAVFCCSLTTTIAAIVHNVVILTYGGLREVLAAIFSVSVALIVANVSVLVTIVFRWSRGSSSKTSHTTSSNHIELGTKIAVKTNVYTDRGPLSVEDKIYHLSPGAHQVENRWDNPKSQWMPDHNAY